MLPHRSSGILRYLHLKIGGLLNPRIPETTRIDSCLFAILPECSCLRTRYSTANELRRVAEAEQAGWIIERCLNAVDSLHS